MWANMRYAIDVEENCRWKLSWLSELCEVRDSRFSAEVAAGCIQLREESLAEHSRPAGRAYPLVRKADL